LRQHGPEDAELPALLSLIRTSFTYMNGVIDPPSSVHKLNLSEMQKLATRAEIWSLGPPLSACIVFSFKPNALYIGKLSVAPTARSQGLARHLIEHATARARIHNLRWLELDVRIELTDNHATFAALGFHETCRTAHAGFAMPTSITFRQAVS
jgi:GNAT superfamily N-acetyltransferase